MRGLVTAGIRIAMIFVFLLTLQSAISNIYAVWTTQYEQQKGDFYILTGLFLFIILILCIVFWKAGSIARFLTGSIDENSLVTSTSNNDLVKCAIFILGTCIPLSR